MRLSAAAAGSPPATRSAFDRALGIALVAISAAVALLLQSGPFKHLDWVLGDITYHRGVALTMQGDTWQGEGPLEGLISYYGGLYPLALGKGAAALGISFPDALSVLSWIATLTLPAALYLLARRIWRSDWLAVGLFVLMGTVVGPLTTGGSLLWVKGILPSAQNFWPAYPRDLALPLLMVALWAAMSERAAVRRLGAGVALAGTGLMQSQMGILAAALVCAWLAWRGWRDRAWRVAVLDVVAALSTAIALSAWWWLPRLDAALDSSRLLLEDQPGFERLRMGPETFLLGYGVVGPLALVGAVLLARRRAPEGSVVFVLWGALLVPLLLLARVSGGSGLFTERRLWLLMSVPLIGAAAIGARELASRIPGAVAAVAVLAVLVLPSVPSALATSDEIDSSWTPGRFAAKQFDLSRWRPVWQQLNHELRSHGSLTALTYDSYAAATWSFSGARVLSLWLGPIKLGFEPADLTGLSYLDRVRLLNRGFSGGIGSLCTVTRRAGAEELVLDGARGLAGTHDLWLASPHRVDVADQGKVPARRRVGPGVTYVDDDSEDYLRLAPGAVVRVPWRSRSVERLSFALRPVGGRPARFSATTGRQTAELELDVEGAVPLATPGGVEGLTMRALGPLELLRVTGFEKVPGLEPPDGPFVVSSGELCGRRAGRGVGATA